MKRLIEDVEVWLLQSGQMFIDFEHVFHPNIYVHIDSHICFKKDGKCKTEVTIFQRFRKTKKHPKGQIIKIRSVTDVLRARIIAKLETDSYKMGRIKSRQLAPFKGA